MDTLARFSTRHMVAVNLALLLWVWAARLLVGTGGWVLLLFPMTVGPSFFLALCLTSVLTWRLYPWKVSRTRPARPGSTCLSVPQTTAQLVAWVGLLGTGFFLVDFGDSPDSEASVFTVLAGGSQAAHEATYVLTDVFGWTAIVGWVALLVLLLVQRRGTTVARRAREAGAGYGQTHSGGYGGGHRTVSPAAQA